MYLESITMTYHAFEAEQSMAYKIFPIPVLHYEIKGTSYTTIGMDIHHHKPSTALARARQLQGYRSHLDSQTKKREANENKSKEDKET